MTPHQQRFKEANAVCRQRARMPKAETWKRFGRCMKREHLKPARKPPRAAARPDVCFRHKGDAINRFADRNRDVIDAGAPRGKLPPAAGRRRGSS